MERRRRLWAQIIVALLAMGISTLSAIVSGKGPTYLYAGVMSLMAFIAGDCLGRLFPVMGDPAPSQPVDSQRCMR